MTVRLALPNKGRLEQPAIDLLRQSGMSFETADRTLAVPVRNMPVELLFVRADDIPELVADGVAELGITGRDLVEEVGLEVEVLTALGFGRCRLTAAVPERSPITSLEAFTGARVATSHPRTAQRFFDDKGIAITPVPLHGSVEVAPKLDVADAIVDLVSSGSTMMINGLRPVVTVLESEALLIGSGGRSSVAGSIATMAQAVVAARRKRYVLMNAPADRVVEIERIIPGIEAPSVVPLAHNGMVAVHSVVDADDVWQVLPELEDVGASGILVLPIQQMIP
jgi:ATP phosphoribosyltransferase